jgi:hypothetical protein
MEDSVKRKEVEVKCIRCTELLRQEEERRGSTIRWFKRKKEVRSRVDRQK